MFLRAFTFFISLVLAPTFALAVDPPVPAASTMRPVACQTRFAQILNSVNGGKARAAAILQAEQDLEKLNRTFVKDIFPETQLDNLGKKVKEKVVLVNAESRLKYQEHFDALWEKRVASGQVPAWELREYRRWLRAQGGEGGAYPAINAKELYTDYVPENGVMSEYFDYKYLEYLRAVKFTRPRGESAEEAVNNYIKAMDKRVLRHYARAIARGTKNYAKTWLGGAAMAGIVLTLPNDLIIQPIKSYLVQETKSLTNQAAESVKDWTGLFVGGEEGYVTALEELRSNAFNFELLDFDNMNRSDALKRLNSFLERTSKQLPLFHKLVLSEQKDFEDIWKTRLNQTRQAAGDAAASYAQYQIATNQLKAIIQSRGDGPPTADELEMLAQYAKEIDVAEETLASVLADWLFIKQAKGDKGLIDAATDRSFSDYYGSYMRSMRVDRLARAINARVKSHVKQLETYSQKATGKKDPSILPSAPTQKPEDQIREESTIKVPTAAPPAELKK